MTRCSTRHENRTRIPTKVVAIPVRKHPILKEPGEDLLESSIRNAANRRTSPKQSKKSTCMNVKGDYHLEFSLFMQILKVEDFA